MAISDKSAGSVARQDTLNELPCTGNFGMWYDYRLD